MTTTTRNGFTSVAQSGSGVTWTGLTNMVYPTEGEGACSLTAYAQESNTIQFRIPQEAAGIPTGATFEEMRLYLEVKKTGTFSDGTNITWLGKTNRSSSYVWTVLNDIDETYRTISVGGDRDYWRISSVYDLSEIIEQMKSGDMYFEAFATSTVAIACGVRVKEAQCIITYTTVEGKRGAIIAALI